MAIQFFPYIISLHLAFWVIFRFISEFIIEILTFPHGILLFFFSNAHFAVVSLYLIILTLLNLHSSGFFHMISFTFCNFGLSSKTISQTRTPRGCILTLFLEILLHNSDILQFWTCKILQFNFLRTRLWVHISQLWLFQNSSLHI